MFVRLCSIEFDYIRLLNCSITERSIAPIAFDRQYFLVSSIGFNNSFLHDPTSNADLTYRAKIMFSVGSIVPIAFYWQNFLVSSIGFDKVRLPNV